ncbi:general stress protein [bacterium]|nr:general stress protein [bacterium]
MALLKLIPIGQAYASESDALEAVDALKANGFEEEDISIVTPTMIESANADMLSPGEKDGVDTTEMLAQVIMSVHEASEVPSSHAMVYAENVQRKQSLVLVTAPFGQALLASDTLATGKHIDVGEMPELEYHTWLQPAPLSALLNIPVLSHRRSWMSRTFDELTEPGYLPTEGIMGGLLKDNPTPLSSKIGMEVLKDNPTPLSSKIGMEVLKDNPTPLSSKFGWKLLKDNATPLSDKLGIKTLSDDESSDKESSFGIPLLSKNPTPLSSLFGIPVLKRDEVKRDD